MLPSEAYLAEQMAVSNPAAVHTARVSSCASVSPRRCKSRLARRLRAANRTPGAYEPDARGGRQARAEESRAVVSARSSTIRRSRAPRVRAIRRREQHDRPRGRAVRAAQRGSGQGRQQRGATGAGRLLPALRKRTARHRQMVRVASHAARQRAATCDRHRAQADAAPGLHAEEPEPRALADFQLLQRRTPRSSTPRTVRATRSGPSRSSRSTRSTRKWPPASRARSNCGAASRRRCASACARRWRGSRRR